MNKQLVELCRRQKSMQEAAKLTPGEGGERSFRDSETALRRALLMERVENNNNNSSSNNNNNGSAPCVFQMLNIDSSIATQLRASLRANGEYLDGDDGDDDRHHRHGNSNSSDVSPTAVSGPSKAKGSTAGSSSSSSSFSTVSRKVQVKQIHIPLTSGMDRLRLNEMKTALKDEYAARYCESLGVAPTPQNTSLVQKLMPFEKCRVYQSTLNVGGRGERRNQIVIEPAPLPAESTVSRGEAPSMLEALLYADKDKKEDTNLEEKKGSSAAMAASSSSPPGSASDNAATLLQLAMQFDAYKNKFVFPFCLPNKFETHLVAPTPPTPPVPEYLAKEEGKRAQEGPQQQLLPRVQKVPAAAKLAMQDQLLHQAMQAGPSSSTPSGGGGGGPSISSADRQALEAMMAGSNNKRQDSAASSSKASGDDGGSMPSTTTGATRHQHQQQFRFSDREAVDATIRKELDMNLSDAVAADANELKLMQQQFVRHFPFNRYDGRLTAEEVQRVKGITLSSTVSNILSSMLKFLWSVYIAPLNPKKYRADGKTTDQLFLDTYKQVLLFSNETIAAGHHGSSPLSSAEMSLFLLCVRVAVDAWFSVRMPSFSQCAVGKSILQRMDHLIMALVDPMGLLSHIAVVESTPAALKVMRSRKLPERVHASVTSPLVLFIIGESAGSHEAKKFAHAKPQCIEDGLNELRKYLTPFVRSQLLRTITEEKLHAQQH